MEVQKVIFNRKNWTPRQARLWLVKNNHKPIRKAGIKDDKLTYWISDKEYSSYDLKYVDEKNVQVVYGIV